MGNYFRNPFGFGDGIPSYLPQDNLTDDSASAGSVPDFFNSIANIFTAAQPTVQTINTALSSSPSTSALAPYLPASVPSMSKYIPLIFVALGVGAIVLFKKKG